MTEDAAAEPLLATVALSKQFGGVVAVADVSLMLRPGEVRGLIGPNGAGKTTLVNLITGIYPPDAGSIRFRGEDVTGLAPNKIARRGMLRTFQTSRLFGNLSVSDNLLVTDLACRSTSGDGARRAAALLELSGLAPLADRPAKTLSGGQRALLQVACGFMVPDLACYVLDEPFAGLNPVIRDRVVELIRRASDDGRGTTFLIVSHEMPVMRELCDSVSVMIDGRLISEGTLAEVAAQPQVVAAYLGQSWA